MLPAPSVAGRSAATATPANPTPNRPPLDLPEHTTAEIVALADRYLTPSYKNAPLVFVGGEGPWGVTQEGERYLDFSAGVAVNALGHNHPDFVPMLQGQTARLIHQSNYWHNAHAVPLARELCERFSAAALAISGIAQPARCFFANSGAEGTEAAVKMARRYHAKVLGKPRPGIVTVEGSFHGRTYAAMTATAQPKYQEGFEPLVPGFRYAKFGDLASIEAQLDDTVGAVLIEVVQGEGGVRIPPRGFFQALRKLCDDRGMLLLLDEVQTGLGRTGSFYAFEQEGIVPDILWLAKALGGGVPIGAVVAKDGVAQALQPGTHATTFGANALATYAGRAVLAILDRDDLVGNSQRMGAYLLDKLRQAFAGRPYVSEIRGRGLMCGVQIQGDPKKVIDVARGKGLLLSVAGTHVLRLTPPLIVDEAHCDLAVQRLLAAADEVLGPPR